MASTISTQTAPKVKEIFKPGLFSRQSKIVPLLPFSAPTMWRRCRQGTFPKPQKLSSRCTVWSNDSLNIWFAEQAKLFGDES